MYVEVGWGNGGDDAREVAATQFFATGVVTAQRDFEM